MREQVYDFPSQQVITKDNVTTEINALLYFQIVDPQKAVYEIDNLPNAIEKLTQTSLRNVIGELELDETLTSRDTINSKLQTILDEATNKWGVKVNRVELQDITPPESVRVAMEKQMQAERTRRAETEAINSTKTDPASYLLAVKYIETLNQMVSGKDNKTIYIPYEASNLLSSIGSIKEIFNK